MKKMMHCAKCKSYTLKKIHCAAPTLAAHPPKFNENDRYGNYRRLWKGIN